MVASQISESAEVLARAFYDDPLMLYIEPDDARRVTMLPWFMGCAARLGDQFGEVYTTVATVEGNACWLRPGDNEIGDDRLATSGFAEAADRMGEGAFGRFGQALGHLENLRRAAVPPEHWYLFLLGVDPPRQGQGVGGALIAPVLAQADAVGVPCYLETMKTRNVPFYRKHGFDVVVEDDIPGGGCHFWTMRRDPR
jgi:GNAT superfamily N-acetyltransferase